MSDHIYNEARRIARRIGKPNPTSAGTDELFKYLKKIDEKSASLAARVEFSTTSPSYITVLDVAGKGSLRAIRCTGDLTINKLFVKVTIDGVVISHGYASGGSPVYPNSNWHYGKSDTFQCYSTVGLPINCWLDYGTSLKIEIASPQSVSQTIGIVYCRE